MIPERAGSRSLRKCLKILERAAQDPWEAAQSPSGTFPVLRRTGPIRKMAPVLEMHLLSAKSRNLFISWWHSARLMCFKVSTARCCCFRDALAILRSAS